MRLFREIELPKQMPISEAIDWIAFGLLPQADWELDENNDPIEARMQVESILERFGHPFGSGSNFVNAQYFSDFLPEVDAGAFLAAFDECLGETPEQVLKSFESWDGMKPKAVGTIEGQEENEELMRAYADRADGLRIELDAAIALRNLRIPIARRESAAQAKLLTKLIDGDVAALGVCVPLLDSEIENFKSDDWPEAFQSILPEYWRIDGVNWQDSNLVSWNNRYLGVVVSTSEILNQFPRPDVRAISLSGTLCGGIFLVESDSPYLEGPRLAQAQRGRPLRTETILEAAISAHLQSLVNAGKFPTKIEAQHAEITDYVRRQLGQELGRTTSQRILADWKKHHAQKGAQK